MGDHKGWYKRRKLPHLDIGGTTQSTIIRLGDSVPHEVLNRLKEELRGPQAEIKLERVRRIEEFLDQGAGSCILRENKCAEIVQNSLLYLHEKSFDLEAWVVMPNHVHFLAHFNAGQPLHVALHSLKSFTGHELKKLHPEMDGIWQDEYFDRFIRNEDHHWRAVSYIHDNPVVARISKSAESFRWSSAFTGD